MKCLSIKSLSWVGALFAVLLLGGCQTANEGTGSGHLLFPRT